MSTPYLYRQALEKLAAEPPTTKTALLGSLLSEIEAALRSRLSVGGVADEWVTPMLRQGDAQVFKKYSQMKLQMKREALEKLNRRAGETTPVIVERMRTVMVQLAI